MVCRGWWVGGLESEQSWGEKLDDEKAKEH